MSSVALLVLLCLTSSLHACNARLLAFTDKEIGKEVEREKLSDETLNLQPNPNDGRVSAVELQRRDREDEAKNNGRIINENYGGANALRPNDLMLNLKKHYTHPVAADGTTSSGNSITKSLSQIELQQSIETKGHEGHARSMLESAPQDTEEAVDNKEGDSVEDIVVMDYAQPHRKPPIHNEKP